MSKSKPRPLKKRLLTGRLTRKRKLVVLVLVLFLLIPIGRVLADLIPTHFAPAHNAVLAPPSPLQTNSPLSLSKEYIYAGGRLIATEEPDSPPPAPSGLRGGGCAGSNIVWTDNSNNENGFKVERSSDNQTYTLYTTVEANSTSVAIPYPKVYPAYYRVRATNSAGDSSPCPPAYVNSVLCYHPDGSALPSYNSLSLNGSSGYVNVPNSSSINVAGSPLTVEAWVKTNIDGTFFNRVVSHYGETNGGYVLDLYHNKIRFWLTQNINMYDFVDGNTRLSPNAWYHIAGVADGQQMRVYLNGVLDGSKSSNWLPLSSPEPLQIGGVVYNGQFNSYFAFNGLIDEVRISASALYSSDFIPQTHLATDSATRALWKFDDQTANDSSGNGNNGTFMGGAGMSTDVAPARELVTWTGQTANVSVTGNNLTKNAGTSTAWDGGAVASRVLASGDGYLELTASEMTTDRLAGLSTSGLVPSYGAIDFGIRQYYGTLYIIEGNGTNRGNFGPYVAGDKLRVAIEGGVVRYYRNNTLLYMSTRQPAYPLKVDACLYDPRATLKNAVLSGNLQ